MRCDPVPVDSSRSAHCRRICIMLHSIFRKGGKQCCDLKVSKRCFYCMQHPKLLPLCVPMVCKIVTTNCVRLWEYSVPERARAVADIMYNTYYYATLTTTSIYSSKGLGYSYPVFILYLIIFITGTPRIISIRNSRQIPQAARPQWRGAPAKRRASCSCSTAFRRAWSWRTTAR